MNENKHDWLVKTDCCMLCGLPEKVAPELFAVNYLNGNESSCYIKRQPITIEEELKMIEVYNGSEFGCMEYKGSKNWIIESLLHHE